MAFQGAACRTAWVVRCKGCARAIAAGPSVQPSETVAVRCPLCGEHRRYLPADVYRGRIAFELIRGGKA